MTTSKHLLDALTLPTGDVNRETLLASVVQEGLVAL